MKNYTELYLSHLKRLYVREALIGWLPEYYSVEQGELYLPLQEAEQAHSLWSGGGLHISSDLMKFKTLQWIKLMKKKG